MQYRLSALAEQDLLEMWLHVAADASVEAADRQIDVIVRGFVLLTEQPRMGRIRLSSDQMSDRFRSRATWSTTASMPTC